MAVSEILEAETVSLSLRDHQSGLSDWQYADLARELHRWVELFDVEFNLNLPSYPVIRFESLRNAFGMYTCGRGEIGTRDNISFNKYTLDRPGEATLGTLLHEMLHLWQHYFGTISGRKYHNAEFRAKALECGLVVDRRGCTSERTEVFLEVLRKHGYEIKPLADSKRPGSPKMKKYNCGCTNVRCAVTLVATCGQCGGTFQSA